MPKGYKDMRDVFADEKKCMRFQCLFPNHWHALATIWACQAGKDVYIEKPACHDPYEGVQMVAAARKYGRMVQVGSQGRSAAYKIRRYSCFFKKEPSVRSTWRRGYASRRRKSIGHTPVEPVPAGVDWDKFRGPAPMIPFSKNHFLYNWHWFWDTGNGDIGNQGVHEMDIARWGWGWGLPNSVVANGGKYLYHDDQETPNTLLARFDYGGKELIFEVRGIQTGGEGALAADSSGNTVGDLFYGSDGWLSLDHLGYRIFKGDPAKLVQSEKAKGDPLTPHIENFLAAVRSRKYQDLNADVEIGRQSADLCHLANISYRLGGQLLKFDPKREQFENQQAGALAHPSHRAPYVIPHLA